MYISTIHHLKTWSVHQYHHQRLKSLLTSSHGPHHYRRSLTLVAVYPARAFLTIPETFHHWKKDASHESMSFPRDGRVQQSQQTGLSSLPSIHRVPSSPGSHSMWMRPPVEVRELFSLWWGYWCTDHISRWWLVEIYTRNYYHITCGHFFFIFY